MIRPCFIVLDQEHAGTLSTRKLVIETAKMNVISSYSPEETIATLERFPKVDAVIMNTKLRGMDCAAVVDELKSIQPGVVVIAVQGSRYLPCANADHILDSFEPKLLLELLGTLFPKQTHHLLEHERELAQKTP